jgi:hypothetical protein
MDAADVQALVAAWQMGMLARHTWRDPKLEISDFETVRGRRRRVQQAE